VPKSSATHDDLCIGESPTVSGPGERLEQWERFVQIPLLVASVLFVVAYAWPILDTGLSRTLTHACEVVVRVTWAGWRPSWSPRFVMAESKWTFLRRHPLDVLAVVPPVLRPLRLALAALLEASGAINREAGGAASTR
jgi:voltage-gated potassium channel